MPRVGSLSRIRLASVSSHLAITTFCWLPPDKRSDRNINAAGMDRKRPECIFDGCRFGAGADEATAGKPVDGSKRDVVAYRERQHETLGLAVFGDQRHADGSALGIARAVDPLRFPADLDLGVDPAKDTEKREQKLALSLSVQPAEADDLALRT